MATAEVVVPGDEERGDELHQLVADVEHGDAYEHVKVVQPQAHGGEHGEDGELAPAAHAVAVIEHKAQREVVVHHNAQDECEGGGDQVVHVQELHEEEQDRVLDDERGQAHQGKLGELLGARRQVRRVQPMFAKPLQNTPHMWNSV